MDPGFLIRSMGDLVRQRSESKSTLVGVDRFFSNASLIELMTDFTGETTNPSLIREIAEGRTDSWSWPIFVEK